MKAVSTTVSNFRFGSVGTKLLSNNSYNMKKKHRKIVVDSQSYGWTVYGSGKERYVSVWQDKKVLFTFGIRASDVTPQMVADAIREYREKQHLVFEN
jgi:hypothetical protein